MIVQEPCFQKKMYLLTTYAIVMADSPETAKRLMVEHTSIGNWKNAEDTEIIRRTNSF